MNSGNNLLFVALSVLLSAVIVSGVTARNSLRQLSLSLRLPENVFAGEKASIKVTLKNLKWIFPSFSIRVENSDAKKNGSLFSHFTRLIYPRAKPTGQTIETPVFRQAAYFPILRAGETRSELTVQSFPHRGLYSLQSFWISTRFPFGFFLRGEHVVTEGEILVYPLIQEVAAFFHLLPFLPGQLEGRNVGQGENLFSIRKHQETESARIIDWKATAKTGELMAREYAKEEENRLCLILDTRVDSRSSHFDESVFEKSVSLAASIAAHFIAAGAEVEFLTPREYVPYGTGMEHLYRVLRCLAVVQREPPQPQPPERLWSSASFPGVADKQAIHQILSDKSFKIILSGQARGNFPSAIWRSSHVVYFDEL